MKPQTTRAVIYGRNSSAKQKSINDQLADSRVAAAAAGWTVVDELSDPSSASRYATKVRKNWARLLELVPTVQVVVMWEPSRGDRTLATWVAFLDLCREHGVRIHAVTHQRTYDPRNARDYRTLAEDGVDSAYESDKISAKVLRGHASSAKAGRPHAPTTYGFERHYDSATKAFVKQVPHPEHAVVVEGIVTAIARGESLSAITQRLNDAGTPTPRGGARWYQSAVKAIARNPAYRPHPDDPEHGIRAHRDAVYVGQRPPLVTESAWETAQRVLGGNSEAFRKARRDSPPGHIKYLLSGNSEVMTAACGSMLSGFCAADGRGATYGCKADRCSNAPMPEVDEYVTRLVVDRLARKDARRLWVEDDTSTRKAKAELKRLQAELAQNERDYRAGVISAKLAGARESELEPQIEDARRRARTVGVPLGALELIDAAKFGRERVRPAWDGLPLLARREIIAEIFSSLTLGPATVRLTRWTPPEERQAIVAERVDHEWRKP